ncbi:hypothetical protein PybrP1_003672 [[Pythium] brassicae (nom. inval.)]|nr:hypothetical protein PybrP1_003672 [[Pythium] brassicae (nom. inval.)]
MGDEALACADFSASLCAERAWRNVQPVLLASFTSVAQLLTAQARRIDALELEFRTAQRSNESLIDQWRAEALETSVSNEALATELRAQLKAETERQHEISQRAQDARIRKLKELRQSDATAASEASDSLRGVVDRISRELQCVNEKLSEQTAAWRRELAVSAITSLRREEVVQMLDRKLDSQKATELLAAKADGSQLEELSGGLFDKLAAAHASVAADFERLRRLESSKATAEDTEQLQQEMHKLLAVVEALQREVGELRAATRQKLSVADAEQLVVSRATLAGLESAIAQFSDDFVRKRDHAGVAQQVQGLKQQLRSEMFHARYIWKEGRPSASQTITWSTQVVNTSVDVFVWKAGSDKVVLKIPGLYHLQAAFFTDFTPTVQVLVNGEPALVLLEDDSDDCGSEAVPRAHKLAGTSNQPEPLGSVQEPLQRATHGLKRVRHSAGNVAGLSVDAFLALPARAVVQISYGIDEKAQGFLSLRKL